MIHGIVLEQKMRKRRRKVYKRNASKDEEKTLFFLPFLLLYFSTLPLQILMKMRLKRKIKVNESDEQRQSLEHLSWVQI